MNLPLCSVAFLLLVNCASQPAQETNSAAPKHNCDGPDPDVECFFADLPKDLSSIMTIAPADEPGSRMIIRGRVLNADTKAPYAGALLYAYHTDNTGHYATSDTGSNILRWHGRLHGWCRTDAEGRYEIHSIRPAGYPNGKAPQHIHAAVQLSNGAAYWINEFVFADDIHLDATYFTLLKEPHNPAELDPGVVTLVEENGMPTGTRDIVIRE